MSNAAAINYGEIMSRFAFAKPAKVGEDDNPKRFEPIASILAHCEERTGAMMPSHTVHA